MSAASSRELRLARRAVKAARTHLSNANVLREMMDHEPAAFRSVDEYLKISDLLLSAMPARAEARQVRRAGRAA